ncbi:hypothetical protein CR513_16772, partial [Mucuna pruriens]
MGWLSSKENGPNIDSNPLPGYVGPFVNAIMEECHHLVKRVEEGPSLVECEENNKFKELLQGLIDSNLVQISKSWRREDVAMAHIMDKGPPHALRPLVIHFTLMPHVPKPLIVQIPS